MDLECSIRLCIAICSYDGLLSETELKTLFDIYKENTHVRWEDFDRLADEVLQSDISLEERFAAVPVVTNELEIAKLAAKSDGFDVRENFALSQCMSWLSMRG